MRYRIRISLRIDTYPGEVTKDFARAGTFLISRDITQEYFFVNNITAVKAVEGE